MFFSERGVILPACWHRISRSDGGRFSAEWCRFRFVCIHYANISLSVIWLFYFRPFCRMSFRMTMCAESLRRRVLRFCLSPACDTAPQNHKRSAAYIFHAFASCVVGQDGQAGRSRKEFIRRDRRRVISVVSAWPDGGPFWIRITESQHVHNTDQ